MAPALSCSLMSSLTRTSVLESRQEECESVVKNKRNSSSDNNFCKKVKLEEMTDTTQKRANFSALQPTSNGVNRTIPNFVNLKPGSAKKLVIKNFKGIFMIVYLLLLAFLILVNFTRYGSW